MSGHLEKDFSHPPTFECLRNLSTRLQDLHSSWKVSLTWPEIDVANDLLASYLAFVSYPPIDSLKSLPDEKKLKSCAQGLPARSRPIKVTPVGRTSLATHTT